MTRLIPPVVFIHWASMWHHIFDLALHTLNRTVS